jgi:hypothetical protein
MNLGDLHITEPYPPAKLVKALAVIADTLHPAFDLRPDIKPFYSRHACVLSSLTVRDFLVRSGFNAIVRPVATVIWAERDGKLLHSLAIGAPHDKRDIKDAWKGHMVVTVKTKAGEFLIDTTLYPVRRPQWRDLPGMMVLPLAAEPVRSPVWWRLEVIASAIHGDDVLIGWFDNPRNKSWQYGGDGRDPTRRMPVVAALIEIRCMGRRARAGRAMMYDWRSIPVPPQMAHLPRDPRGFPIFVMAYRDDDGRAHFTINEEHIRQRVIRRDLCSICGRGLLRGRWFVGGEKSAFHPHGAYIDPPMHSACAHYALRVCPYLAAPTYATPIAGRTVSPDDPTTFVNPTAIISPSTIDELRPALFVAVLARGQHAPPGRAVIFPARPYITVEYWQHGAQLPRAEGEALCRAVGLEPTAKRIGANP